MGSHFLSRFQFAHALFQQYLYNGLGAGERRLLHGEIANVLEELYDGQTEEITPQLAHHFAEAGEGEKAIDYLLEAGDRARMLYAQTEAIDYYRRALVFLREQGEPERAARTLMKLGLTYDATFDFRRARQAYDEGFALWQRAGQIQPPVPRLPAPHALRVPWYYVQTLDPAMCWEMASSNVIRQLFSGLVEASPEMGVVPGLARRWEVLKDGREYIFHLRDGVRWSDGAPVTARDFEYAWKRVLDPGTGSPRAERLYDVKGARAFHRGEVSDPELVGVRSLDEHTLLVELEAPTGFFVHMLAQDEYLPVPRHVVEAHGGAWTRLEKIVTNGPFRLEAWQPGESLVLLSNLEYYSHFRGNVERVELSLAEDDRAKDTVEMYEAGDLDILSLFDLSPLEAERARQLHADEYITVPGLSSYCLALDVSRSPFSDPRVRRAFALATDRETLAGVVLMGHCSPATGGFLPPGIPGHSPGIGMPYDPGEARRLLAESGYAGGRGFPTVVPWLYHSPFESACAYLQAQWRENLGIEILWEVMEWTHFIDSLNRELPHMHGIGFHASFPDPACLLRGDRDWLRTGWHSEAYDRLVGDARCCVTQEERIELYRQADTVLVEGASILPLIYERWNLLVKPWVKKYPLSGFRVFWKDVIIEPH